MRVVVPKTLIPASNPTQNLDRLLIQLNSLIAKQTRSQQFIQALNTFKQINLSHHLKPDQYSLATTLTACAKLHDILSGNQLHARAIHAGFKSYSHVANTLLSMYSNSNDLNSLKLVFEEIVFPDAYSWTTLLSAYTKSGQIAYACHLFEQTPQKSISVWNAIVTGCVKNECQDTGFRMFQRMRSSGVRPDHYTFASILSSCCSPESVDLGRQVHALVVRSGFLDMVSVINSQLTMYFKCGMVREACNVFEETKTRTCNQITFNAMIAGLVKLGRDMEALMMFGEMKEASFTPTEATFTSIMRACSSARVMKLGQEVHAETIKIGLNNSTAVSNATMSMYTNCGDSGAACLVFKFLEEKDLVSWNSIVECYAQQHSFGLGITMYLQMQTAGIKPDEFTIGSLLSCSSLGGTKMIHALVVRNGLVSNIQVCNALVCAFSKHGKIVCAYQVFTDMIFKNLISWNSIISRCLYNGMPMQTLNLFGELLATGIQPDFYTLSIILSTCTSISVLRIGKQVHAYILRSRFSSETPLANALITMYAKCGGLSQSFKVFAGMAERDIISWNAMIDAYALHGEGKEAIRCFEEMKEADVVKPDHATFTTVLSACSHAGLINEGRQIFSSMEKDYNIEPRMDQYSCIIDLLGRAGRLDEAESLVNAMPFRADSTIWWALLSASVSHVNVRLGRIAAEFLLDVEPDDSAIYVQLSNLYAADGKWEEAASVRNLMLKNRVTKQPGYSWI